MGYNVSYKNGANGVSNFIKGKPSSLWDFVCDHPIISFLIADKVITGVVNIVNGKVNGRDSNRSTRSTRHHPKEYYRNKQYCQHSTLPVHSGPPYQTDPAVSISTE